MEDGEEVYVVKAPALGLWRVMGVGGTSRSGQGGQPRDRLPALLRFANCVSGHEGGGMLFSVMNILFPLMKIFCVRLISLLFYYFQFHFLHKCSRMGHKYKDCL